ncbi:hypothetical protein QBC42DRAFT_351113 [Cladorrhinum samala]|uniref:RING-type domain-containing protein n=1 Tax=Cladorrhinum samala TaxID=585594 RepID=A0AAV9H8L3_9PEZI|nr:hypothetical protein QBC42DRAFT_351113 [Cladorrhinum samala]
MVMTGPSMPITVALHACSAGEVAVGWWTAPTFFQLNGTFMGRFCGAVRGAVRRSSVAKIALTATEQYKKKKKSQKPRGASGLGTWTLVHQIHQSTIPPRVSTSLSAPKTSVFTPTPILFVPSACGELVIPTDAPFAALGATCSPLRDVRAPTMTMFVDEIRNVVLLFSNPSWVGAGTVSSTVIRNVTRLSGEIAYSSRYAGNTTVLSTRFAGTANGVIQGLLYVPSLPAGDSCIGDTSIHIPSSAVRQNNLPPTNYHLIALAPWVSPHCAMVYMAAARTAPVRGFIFYVPGNSTDSPPPADDPQWAIDEEASWRAQTGYPVYAVSALAGQVMMQHLSLYSGNLTEVPYGQNISERFRADPTDYARIWTELTISTPPSGFATWVYVLIVLGVLLIVIFLASSAMHFAQARRRASLRRRVLAGEVNLEAMGIKRLTVPMDYIQGFPLFTYHYEPDVSTPPASPRSARISSRTGNKRQSRDRTNHRPDRTSQSEFTAAATMISEDNSADFPATNYQPLCEICLVPYRNRVTIIRELPCGHIFHPECVDEFLHHVSSLCPLCKASMLPPGFCPKITNGMARRERAIRQIRGRIDDDPEIREACAEQEQKQPGKHWKRSLRNKFFPSAGGGNLGIGPSPTSSTDTELKELPPPAQKTASQQRIEPQVGHDGLVTESNGGAGPTTLARERMRELAGSELDDDTADDGSTRWKRIRNRVFPGFD